MTLSSVSMPGEGPLIVLEGSTFCVSGSVGDVVPGRDAEGFFSADMRHLSIWQLLVDGQPLRLLSSRNLDHRTARIFATVASARVGHDPVVSVRRDRWIDESLHEDVLVENHSGATCNLQVEIRYGADFADLFEVRERIPKRGRGDAEVARDHAVLEYERDGFRRATVLTFDRTPDEIEAERACFRLALGPRERWRLHVDVRCAGGTVRAADSAGATSAAQVSRSRAGADVQAYVEEAPRLEAASEMLLLTYRQSLVDLAALHFRPLEDESWQLPAAGLPWFMALFGRDSIIVSYQALPFDPSLAATTLQALAALQARSHDDFRDAEPGKILHELRRGELAHFRDVPQSPYYGSHDATPLFVVLLDEYELWTGDQELVRRLEPAARAALEWLDRHGDRDGDGYLEYLTRSPQGLVNQCWKDSWNSIQFADGSLTSPPTATCELQGYAYDARRRAARLARSVWADAALADRLEAAATDLRLRFNTDFWSEEHGHYVLALDQRKRQVDALASNVGHLLWSGIVDEERAPASVRRLMEPDMFNGWGIRTLSARAGGFNPVGYHNGSVWPHDTGLAAEGMRSYGYREEASALVGALVEAAGYFAHRLPETFAGFDRGETAFPVAYPSASRPQAWAAGAPLLGLRTLLGLDVTESGATCHPHLTGSLRGGVRLLDVPIRGQRRSFGR